MRNIIESLKSSIFENKNNIIKFEVLNYDDTNNIDAGTKKYFNDVTRKLSNVEYFQFFNEFEIPTSKQYDKNTNTAYITTDVSKYGIETMNNLAAVGLGEWRGIGVTGNGTDLGEQILYNPERNIFMGLSQYEDDDDAVNNDRFSCVTFYNIIKNNTSKLSLYQIDTFDIN